MTAALGLSAPPANPRRSHAVTRLAAGGVVSGLALSATAVWFGGRLPAGSPDWLIPGSIGAAWLGFALAALLVTRVSRRTGVALVLAGAVVKLTPLIVLPAVLRRWPVALVTALSTVVGVLYLPHLLTVGWSTLGYLGGYAQEEGYADGRRFALIPLPSPAALAVAVTLLAAAALWAWQTARPEQPWHAAAVTTGALLLVSTPDYPWYALLLVGLVGLGARIEWLAIAAAGYVVQWAPELHLDRTLAQRLSYGLAGLVVLAGWAWRRRRVHSGGDGSGHRLSTAAVSEPQAGAATRAQS